MTLARAAVAVGFVALAPAWSHAHQPPPEYRLLRPALEFTSWVGAGGGALVGAGAAPAVFDLRVGGDGTAAVGGDGDLRLGPYVEAGTSTFATLQATAGVELFVGAVPRPLRMFYYAGEGVFVARLGAGWAWRSSELPAAASTAVATLTVAYGYRAPFALREPRDQRSPEPDVRAPNRYMTGARLWVGAVVDLREAPAWQLTGGIEFEPVGTLRYLLGLY